MGRRGREIRKGRGEAKSRGMHRWGVVEVDILCPTPDQACWRGALTQNKLVAKSM